MTKIILCCSAGMSTSLLVSKLKKYADETNVPIDIAAIPMGDLDDYISDDVSIYVLAPQVKYHREKIAERTKKPVYVIEMRDYGTLDVKKVLPAILEAAAAK